MEDDMMAALKEVSFENDCSRIENANSILLFIFTRPKRAIRMSRSRRVARPVRLWAA